MTVTIPTILKLDIRTNGRLFNYFSLGEVIDKSLFLDNKTKYELLLEVTKEPLNFKQEALHDFSSYYKVGSTSIYLERRYSGLTCKLLVNDINSNSVKMYCNKNYLRLIRLKLDNLYPVGVHANDILMLRMIANNDLVLHAASLQKPNSKGAFLLLAPPDTGKTYTTFRLLERGYKFLGEDLSYYSSKNGRLYCMPYTSTWGHHFGAGRKRAEKIPFIQLFVEAHKKTVDDFFGPKSVVESATLDTVFILEKGINTGIHEIKYSKPLENQIMSIQRNEFTYFKNPLIRAFEYFNDTGVDDIFENERTNLRQLLKSKKIYRVTARSYSGFETLIHSKLTEE